ncbi:hypothetical protein NLJ89_g6593 [Agrocybe chaxingu]|uniref:DUF6533 domain-containing protein n=1 Tax=Agrocybe chaxingu TaxID=84603 RepID=A0A9W8MTX8_9AGAR|nr:hypothetical protein NLJ89_g6593 [Agrocybe chaxingu]
MYSMFKFGCAFFVICAAPSFIAASALLYYDYAITWPREVQYIWMRKFSFATALYFACRYGMVSNVIYALALTEKIPMMRDRVCVGNSEIILLCDQGYRLAAIVACIGRIAIVLVWGLRTYAISNRNMCVLTIFGLFGSSVIGLAILHVPLWLTDAFRVPYLLPIFTVIFETSAVVFTTGRTVKALAVDHTPWRDAKRGLPFLIFKHVVLQHAAPVACHGPAKTSPVVLIHFYSKDSLSNGYLTHTHSRLPSVPPPFTSFLTISRFRLSGLMTARFLLHLRVWSHRRCTNSFVETPTLGLFKITKADAELGYSARASFIMRSIVDEFGEDPVAQAHQEAVSAGCVEDIERAERHATEAENSI